MRGNGQQMTEQNPARGTPPRDVLSEVMELYDTAIEVFTETMREVREEGRIREANSYVRELGKIVLSVITERERLEKLRKLDAGAVHDQSFDLGAARGEIGRRLARLRDAGNG